MAQINQPVVALPQLSGRRPDAVTLWIANDLPAPIPRAWPSRVKSAILHAISLAQFTVAYTCMARIPPHRRPLYPPTERMAILEVTAIMCPTVGVALIRLRSHPPPRPD